MLELDGRVLRAVWTVFLFVLVVALIYLTRHTLVIFTLAIFLAHLLAPLVNRVQRIMPRGVPRNVALAIVYLVLIAAVVAALVPIGTKIGEQATALAGRLPDIVKQDPLGHLPLPARLEVYRPRLAEFIAGQTAGFENKILPALQDIGPKILIGLGSLVPVVLIPILSFFFLKDGTILRGDLVECFAPRRRSLLEEILDDLHVLVAQYIRALVLLAMATFVSYSIFLSATGVPYAILLAGVACVLELIPFVGPLSAAVITILVAALSGYPHLLWLVIFLGVYRLFQDYVLSPFLLSSGVELHPLMVIFGVLAGEQVAGIPGMFFSVPVIAALRILLVRMRRRKAHA
jgi:predicted PurR-regulated permease PerM